MNDLIGQKFGRLTVIEVSNKIQKYNNHGIKDGYIYYYKCQCECGNIIEVSRNSLRFNKTKSCGCLKSELSAQRKTTHGLRKHRIYRIYYGMINRCYNTNEKCYCNYGGRGIEICDEWKNDFKSFYNWSLANGYNDNLSIDRINVNGNYEPTNCRWITMTEQAGNKRSNHLLTFNNQTHSLSEWSKITGIKAPTIRARINKYNWSVEEALTILGK